MQRSKLVVFVTEDRYETPKATDTYIKNILQEDTLLTAELESLGYRVIRKSWSNPSFDWATADIALIRTTWDYFYKIDAFTSWLESVKNKCALMNSYPLLTWNMNKRYLLDLEQKGVPIPNTVWCFKGTTKPLSEIVTSSQWKEFILKPLVSGSARHTYRFTKDNFQEYETIFADLVAQEDMMLQEFQQQVLLQGEWSFILFQGKFSHAILKKAKLGDFRVQDDYGGTIYPYQPTTTEILFAENVVQQCSEIPAYARVDVMQGNNKQLVLIELELIEPELWYREYPEAAAKMANCLHQTWTKTNINI